MRGYIGDYTKRNVPSTWTLFTKDQPKNVFSMAMSFLPQIVYGLDIYFVSDDGKEIKAFFRDGFNARGKKENIEILEKMEYGE